MDDHQTATVIGLAIEVHTEFGPGFLEAAYARALEMELIDRGIAYQREVCVTLFYKGRSTGVPYRLDFLLDPPLILELKALPDLGRRERYQAFHYLKATGFPKALILNFGRERLQVQRVTWP